jgi:GTP:adenosylcobinamide-phosphate guanylyltransferase
MTNPQPKYTAVILAADRGSDDPVARAAAVSCKSLAPVGGRPLVFRVLDALEASQAVDTCILSGPSKSILDREPALGKLVSSGGVKWFENLSSPSSSAYHVLQSLPDESPVLLTTADHALLSDRIVDHFCSEAMLTSADVVVGIAQHERVTRAFPQTRRTATRLKDGAFCGCNLFAFLTPQARLAADFWRQVEHQRKNPLQLIRVLGWMSVWRYISRQLSLSEALDRISDRLGFKAGVVVMPFPEAALDVDSVDDLRLIENIISGNDIDK